MIVKRQQLSLMW